MTEPALPFDAGPLVDALQAAGVTVEGPLSASRIGLGQSNLTYLVLDKNGARMILRSPPRGHLLASAHDVGREARVLRALESTPVPVPRVLLSTRSSEISDSPIVVMEHVAGVVIDTRQAADQVSLSVRGELGQQMARVLASIHAVDVRGGGLDDLASHSSYAGRQLKRWSGQWEASKTRELLALDRLTDLLQRHAPDPRPLCLVHGDFHIRNMIVDVATSEVRAVLDWELATLGEPLADLGTMLAYWTESSDPETGLFDAVSMPGFIGRDEVTETYLAASGQDGRDLGYWHTLGLWKIAIIAEGIVRRTFDEPTNAAAGGAPAPGSTENIVDHAWAVAADAGLA
ncbi:putative Acyl-CoA dehydrogenase [metagenome]|uniref:Putative Acyl-CoA dehydrogenase n=1 Tax=metagenome TaxID=256318 RepID=A0A2P2C0G7_9ZZZZ